MANNYCLATVVPDLPLTEQQLELIGILCAAGGEALELTEVPPELLPLVREIEGLVLETPEGEDICMDINALTIEVQEDGKYSPY